jgi:hypothetical protein
MKCAHIKHSLGLVDLPSYPCHHVQPYNLWCWKWAVTKTVFTQLVTQVLYMCHKPCIQMFCICGIQYNVN